MSGLRELVEARFVSGNSVPVERVHITRAEFDELTATPPAAAPDEAMVERAEVALAEYWQDADHVTTCDRCNGRGEDSGDWCGDCGGTGEYHAGTDAGALRAALTAALTGAAK